MTPTKKPSARQLRANRANGKLGGRPRLSEELARIRGTRRPKPKPAAPAPYPAPPATPEQLAATAAVQLFEAAALTFNAAAQHAHASAAILARWRREHPGARDFLDVVNPHTGRAVRTLRPWLPDRVCRGCQTT
jgi:hypothetical protein